jgi:hypothetical protein
MRRMYRLSMLRYIHRYTLDQSMGNKSTVLTLKPQFGVKFRRSLHANNAR